MVLTSPAFENNGRIPVVYTCDGDGTNPPLEISDIPEGAVELALSLEDPDAPVGVFTHWLVWNLPPTISGIDEGALPKGAMEGRNSANRSGYFAPCPTEGTHHYHFQVFALSEKLEIESGADRDDFEDSLKGKVLARAELVGRYSTTSTVPEGLIAES